MRRTKSNVGVVLAAITLLAVMGTATYAATFTEDWNNAGNGLNGWTATENGLTYQATGGVGNTGYVKAIKSATSIHLAGAKATSVSGVVGNVNATYGNIIQVSIDVKIFGTGADAVHNASGWRLESGGSGWTRANLFDTPNIDMSNWTTLTTVIDTTMSDAAAISAGWTQAFGSSSFANTWTNITFWDVFDGVGTTSVSNREVGLDNFRIDSVPEPASLALIGLGGLAMLSRKRRR